MGYPLKRSPSNLYLFALSKLLDGLGYPYNPPTCVYVLLGCVATLREEFASPKGSRAGLDTDACNDAAVSFVTAPRTQREMAALLDAMECTCDAEMLDAPGLEPVMHRAGQGAFGKSGQTRPLFTLLLEIIQPVSALALSCRINPGAYALHKPHKREQQAQRPDGLVLWPQNVTQLIPHGAEDSIHGLVAWMSLRTDIHVRTHIISFLDVLLRLAHAKVIPFVISSSSTLLRGIIDGLEADNSRWHRRTNRDITLHRDTYAAMLAASRFLDSVVHRMNYAQHRAFFRPHAGALLAWCDKSATLVSRLKPLINGGPGRSEHGPHESARGFDVAGALVFHYFPDTRAELPAHNPLASAGRAFAVRRARPVFRAVDALAMLDQRGRCGAPGCLSTFVDVDAHRTFRHCAGCRRVPYCSRACQARAWVGPVPHRDACAVMRTLCHELQLKRHRQILAMFRPRDGNMYDDMCTAVADHLEALGRLDLETSEYRPEQEWEADRQQLLQSRLLPA